MNDPKHLIDLLERSRRSGTVASPEQREENLRRLIRAAMPQQEVSEALRRRVRALEAAPIAPARSPTWRRRGGRLRWAIAATLAVGALVIKIVQPTWVAARALQRMQAAIADARSAHDVFWRISKDGHRVKASESWYQRGRWRLNDLESGRVEVFTEGKLWRYEPKTHSVTVRRTSGPFGYNPSGFSLAARRRDYARWGWHIPIRVQGEVKEGGRPALQVIIQREGDAEREARRLR